MLSPEPKIANKYIVGEQLGKGKFGTVYLGTHHKTGAKVAIKCENVNHSYKSIKHETTILNYLFQCGGRSIPAVLYYGVSGNFTCLVMDYYDTTLEHHLRENPQTISKFMASAIQILQFVHGHQILHRDIKPDNFMVKDRQLFLIDFGMAAAYHPEIAAPSREHIVGTPKYVSYFVHDGCEPSMRDDLISLGYCYLYMVCGLPWSGVDVVAEAVETSHILHSQNQQRKILKEWGNIDVFAKPHNVIHMYLEYCYHHSDELEYDLLKQMFLV